MVCNDCDHLESPCDTIFYTPVKYYDYNSVVAQIQFNCTKSSKRRVLDDAFFQFKAEPVKVNNNGK